jgi:hypothetical protein
MKLITLVAAITFCMASCNDAGTSSSQDTDSTSVSPGMNDNSSGSTNMGTDNESMNGSPVTIPDSARSDTGNIGTGSAPATGSGGGGAGGAASGSGGSGSNGDHAK